MSTPDDALGESRIGKRERFSNEATQAENESDQAHSITRIYLDLMKEDSPFFSTRSVAALPEFEVKEVSLVKRLGQGEFGIVYSVGAFHVEDDDEPSSPPEAAPETQSVSAASDTPTNEGSVPQTDVGKDNNTSPGADGSGRISSSKGTNQAMNSENSAILKTSSTAKIGRKDSTVSFAENPASIIVPVEDELSDDSSLSDDEENDENAIKIPGPNVSKSYMKTHIIRDGKPRYAVKRLRRDLTGDKLFHATSDLASEAHFLKSLRHPNICKMRGTISKAGKKDFGIILDRLDMTLRDKMYEWKKEEEGGSFFSKLERLLHRPKSKKEEELQVHKELYATKLMALYDTARALRYLAKHSIVFRDLKPENLAFDYRGDVRLFDFGLAKELKAKDKIVDDKYNLTGLTGSRRYMAPEVILCKAYGLSVDVYSFAVMFWEVMSNKNAYHYLTFEKHFEMVVTLKKRPNLKKMIPNKGVLPEGSTIHKLVEQSWDPDPSKRPKIATLCEMLADEAREASGGMTDSIGPMDRTTFLVAQSLRSRAEVA